LIEGDMRGPTTITWDESSIIEVRNATRADDVIDGVLTPGFIDAQVNGIGEDSVVGPDCDVRRMSEALRRQGVTTWLPTIPTQSPDFYGEPLDRVRERFSRAEPGFPDALGLHFEGPLLGERPGAHRPEWFSADPHVVAELRRAVMVTVAPEHSLSAEIIPQLTGQGVVVALGHSSPTHDQFRAAVAGGARHATHLFNAMSGVNHIEPGLATFVLTDGTLTFSAIADLVHVHPTVLRLIWQAAGDRMTLVSDQISTGVNKPSQQNARLAGATTGLDASLRNLVQTCGIPLRDVLVMVSERPAEVLGLHDRGVIRRGLRPDLVLLSNDLEVRSVVSAGFLWSSSGN
jgi:N-acetylglucosamine-6-phosphate deacetylase